MVEYLIINGNDLKPGIYTAEIRDVIINCDNKVSISLELIEDVTNDPE